MSSRQLNRQAGLNRRLPHPRKPPAEPVSASPPKADPERQKPWSNNTKLAVSLSLVALLAWLLNRFRNVVGLLLLAVLLAYLLYPVVDWMRKNLKISWRFASTLIFLLSVLVVFGLLFWGGFAIVTQTQSLITFLQSALENGVDRLVNQPLTINFYGFQFSSSSLTDLEWVSQELTGLINPVLTRTTSLLTSVASGAASFIGWTFFTLLITYFILAESSGIPGRMIRFTIPGYGEDTRKLGRYLAGIWNAFLRGQLIIILITVFTYFILLSILGVRFALGLALLAGLARFVPYVGPAVAWTSYGLVAFFQDGNLFNLAPLWFVVLVVGVAWLTDLILDNFVAARLMGDALQIHPAAVMVSAIIAANLLGVIGVILAAPVVATMKLAFEYVINKMLDRDPWAGIKTKPPLVARSLIQFVRFHLARARSWLTAFQKDHNA